jgi:hypothetical protein
MKRLTVGILWQKGRLLRFDIQKLDRSSVATGQFEMSAKTPEQGHAQDFYFVCDR